MRAYLQSQLLLTGSAGGKPRVEGFSAGLALIVLKILSVTILAIGALKVTLGAKADRLLDPSISLETVLHPSVDSQIRFYGAAFSVYGVLLWMCSNDMKKYADFFKVLMIVFFLAGVARIPSALIEASHRS